MIRYVSAEATCESLVALNRDEAISTLEISRTQEKVLLKERRKEKVK